MKILVSVFNNLYTDQRIEKICQTLHENGYEIILIGNSWGGLPEMKRPYFFNRIKLKAKSLKFAYPEFNIKLCNELLKHADQDTILLSNDLDTMVANFMVSKKLKIPLVFDSHEIFTEMPSVKGRFVQKIWRFIEGKYLPKIRYMITASESYANWFVRKYSISKPVVIQNFPKKINETESPEQTNHPKIILYQGAINPSRGLDKVIPAMAKISDAELWIAGNGPKLEEYKQLTEKLNLIKKVKFLGNLVPDELRKITAKADVGLSIEENNGLSYYYSLPNKISDYIQAKVPIVTSNFPEMQKIMNQFEIGATIENHSIDELSNKINEVLENGKNHYQKNLEIAANTLNWQSEEPKLLQLYQKVVLENFKK